MRGQYTADEYTPDQLSAMGAEEFLTVCGAEFTVMTSGLIRVTNTFSCAGLELEKLPDLSAVVFEGSFICRNNFLKDLTGAPREVHGDFSCVKNKLITLKGAPPEVGGDFACSLNELETLHDAPRRVGNTFLANYNNLKTLEGAPEEVGGWFNCGYNQLVSLKGCPRKISGGFICCANRLETLEHAPDEIGAAFMLSGNPLKDFSALSLCNHRVLTLDQEQISTFEGEWKKLGLRNALTYLQTEYDGVYAISRDSVTGFFDAVRARAQEAAEHHRNLKIIKRNQAAFRFRR